jgi:ABC-type antimicrobial peptide transport system permease subunit
MDPNLPVPTVESMGDIYLGEVAQDRFNALLLTVFAITALLLAAGGTYGVMAYAVARRSAELGVRLALGADATRVLRLVLREGLAMGGWGLFLGLGATIALGRAFSSILFNVTPLDPPVLLAAAGVLVGVVLLSGYLPARRASNTDPMTALRAE